MDAFGIAMQDAATALTRKPELRFGRLNSKQTYQGIFAMNARLRR
jgi:hypothetical protein